MAGYTRRDQLLKSFAPRVAVDKAAAPRSPVHIALATRSPVQSQRMGNTEKAAGSPHKYGAKPLNKAQAENLSGLYTPPTISGSLINVRAGLKRGPANYKVPRLARKPRKAVAKVPSLRIAIPKGD